MTVACYFEPSKPHAKHWMRAFADGCEGRVVQNGVRDSHATEHVVMGNWPVATRLIAEFAQEDTPFWYLDSAYVRGAVSCDYLRIERGRFWPNGSSEHHTMDRALSMGVEIQPWRRNGDYVLICLHGPNFGKPWGIDSLEWNAEIETRVRAMTDRPIVVRPKPYNPAARRAAPPLTEQLAEAWCVVTHSSTIGVQAALAGVPVFCEPTCAAAPVARTDLEIEEPVRPDREQWIADLAWRQWSRAEMVSGEAWEYVKGMQ